MPKNLNSNLWVISVFLKTTCGLEGGLIDSERNDFAIAFSVFIKPDQQDFRQSSEMPLTR
jgi:hypothetical protein